MERLTTAERIHIIGGPGSGKTTLARHLAHILQIPMHELDAIGYGGAGAKQPLERRLADVHDIASQPAWITEGIFLWWTDELVEHADVIIWLDPSTRIALWRIVSRHVRMSIAGTNQHRGTRALVRFTHNAARYYREPASIPKALDDDTAVTRAATMEALEKVGQKVIRCRRQRDVMKLLKPCNMAATRRVDDE